MDTTRLARLPRRVAGRLLRPALARVDRIGWRGSSAAVEHEAAGYWADTADPHWASNSHWRTGLDAQWDAVGRDTLAIAERLVATTGRPLPDRRTVEWGCGGGANAVVLAPRTGELVAVDIAADSVEECRRQVAAVCDTPVLGVVADALHPEGAVERIGAGSCDLFVCVYVLELVPSKEYGLRLLAIAAQLLADGGVALVQVKYATGSFGSRTRRRGYRRDPANMTTYGIDELWEAASERGLTPHAIELVPRNALDERYAYYLLSRSPRG